MALSFSRVAEHKQFGQWIKYCMVEFDFSFAFICLRARTNAFWMAVSRKLVNSIIECTVKLYTKLQRERIHIHEGIGEHKRERNVMVSYSLRWRNENKTNTYTYHFCAHAYNSLLPLARSLCLCLLLSIAHTLFTFAAFLTFQLLTHALRNLLWTHLDWVGTLFVHMFEFTHFVVCKKCVLEHAEHMRRIQTFAQRFGSQTLSLLAKLRMSPSSAFTKNWKQ